MQYQIRQVKSEGIHSPQKVVDLVTDHRQWHIELRIVGRKGRFDGSLGYLSYNRVFINQQTVIPANEEVSERLSIDKECHRKKEDTNAKNSFHGLYSNTWSCFCPPNLL